jgi:hypothetical protein
MADFPSAVQFHNVNPMSPFHNDSIGYGLASIGPGNGSATWVTASSARLFPFRIHSSTTYVKAIWLNGTTTSGNVDAGLYDVEGNRLVSTGSTAQGTVSVWQEADITDTTLRPGLYYMAIVMDNTTGHMIRWNPTHQYLTMLGCQAMASAFPLPTTLTFAAYGAAYIPTFAFTQRPEWGA